jgi:uncharacterized repeat protein (TIGR01451 family)
MGSKRTARAAMLVALWMMVASVGSALAAPGDITLASTSDNGVKGSGFSPSLSGDGTRVAFLSVAFMDPADIDGFEDVYVKDLMTGNITLASTSDSGVKGDSANFTPSLSTDGTRVAFMSVALGLDPADTDRFDDIYVKDLASGDITLASTSDSGIKGDLFSLSPSLSADGTRVAFRSVATNLDLADSDSISDIYVKDLVTGDVTLASISDDGVKANSESFDPSLSGDSTKVAFWSDATNLDPADSDGISDIYVMDLVTGDITLASTSDDGVKANSASSGPRLSADGTRVAFLSDATNLDPADTDSIPDVYVKDLVTGNITLATTSNSGVKANSGGFSLSLSADGTKVAFWSDATNLDPADTDSNSDIYVKDLVTGDITLASTSDGGVKANSYSFDPSLSADGATVAFGSYATNLHPAATDGIGDVYVKELGTPAASADLSVVKSDRLDPVRLGVRVVYTVKVDNQGPNQATGVTVTDQLPTAVRFVSAAPSQGRCDRAARLLTCDLGTVPSGDSVNVRVVVEPRSRGLLRNTVEVTANESDPNTANNSDVETTRVR